MENENSKSDKGEGLPNSELNQAQEIGAENEIVKDSRRRAVQGLLAGTGAIAVGAQLGGAEGWLKPTLNAVVLPAHAQASNSFVIAGVVGGGDTTNLLDHFISPSYAQTEAVENPLTSSCISFELINGNVSSSVSLTSGQVLIGEAAFAGASLTFSVSGGGRSGTVNATFNDDASPTSASGDVELEGFIELFSAQEGATCVTVTTTAVPNTTSSAT